MKLRFSYLTLLLFVIALSFFLLTLIDPFAGGAAWVCLIFTLGVGSMLQWKRRGLPGALLAGAVLIAHFNAYKIYGSPEIRPVTLVAPVTIERLELPNTLVLSDGSTRKLRGVKFIQPLKLRVEESLLSQIKDVHARFPGREDLEPDDVHPSAEVVAARAWSLLRPRRRLNLKVGDGFETELVARVDGSVDGTVLRPWHYWCGNSFFARFFPEDLPSAIRLDLAAVLVSASVADSVEPEDDGFDAKLRLTEMLRYAD